MTDLDKLRNELLLDPEFREYYYDQKIDSDIAKAIVKARIENNLTQKELSELTGIAQGDISKYESCSKFPTVSTLKRIAKATNHMLKIEFIPISLEDASEE